MKLSALFKLLIIVIVLPLFFSPASAEIQKPNVIIILVDDMGYSDIGSFGGEIETPNIDNLAQQGVKFTQFYNTSRCSSSRASILTGHYPHQVQMGHLAGKRFQNFDGYKGDLTQEVTTLPEALKDNGYTNYMVGKWHVAHYGVKELNTADISALDNTPTKRGFDQFYGTLLGGNNYFSPRYLFRNDKAEKVKSDDYYYTDALSEEAVGFINQHDQEQPYFMYVAYTAPHWPIQAPIETINKYRDIYQQGWDKTRTARYNKMLSIGLITKNSSLSPRDADVPAWQDAKDKNWQIERMAVHAAMVDHIDQGVGMIVSAVAKTNQLENTLIMFLSDNGASAEVIPTVFPEYVRKNVFAKYTPDSGEKTVIGNDVKAMPGGKTTFQSIGLEWANVSNTPFRKHKSMVHEGGIATPLIVHWPKGINTAESRVINTPGHIIDIMATVLDATNTNDSSDNSELGKLSGISLLPQLSGKTSVKRMIFWEHEGNRAVRDGRWKLISTLNEQWQLFDIENDRSELNDLAQRFPERVIEMEKQYEEYAKSHRVLPWKQVTKDIKMYKR